MVWLCKVLGAVMVLLPEAFIGRKYFRWEGGCMKFCRAFNLSSLINSHATKCGPLSCRLAIVFVVGKCKVGPLGG